MTLARLDHAVDFEVVVRAHDRASRLVPHLRRRVIAPVVPISRPGTPHAPDVVAEVEVRVDSQ